MNKILLVDDESNVRLVYKEVLNDVGYYVLEAESGEETFRILTREPVDLIILDIKLRLESGLNVLQRIKEEFPGIPVLLCTGYACFRSDSTSWFAENYIVKSSDSTEILQEVNKVLGERDKDSVMRFEV
ncbi:MAG TPA: response regulator [Thermodesulfobacteriota bacterium]|nr:response regulator [Thermodesulfobacteriota bacterium]